MNVNDMRLTEEEKNPKAPLEAIFAYQKELLKKYHDIEKKSGLLQCDSIVVPIDDKFGQARLKDFAWRVTEELGEATDALVRHPKDLTHYQEEMIDALHFYVELLIISKVDISYMKVFFGGVEGDLLSHLWDLRPDVMLNNPQEDNYKVVQYLSNAMNCLKNKPWKQSHILTDQPVYKANLCRGFDSLIGALYRGSMSPQSIYDLYVLKNKVNQFRQRSNY